MMHTSCNGSRVIRCVDGYGNVMVADRFVNLTLAITGLVLIELPIGSACREGGHV